MAVSSFHGILDCWVEDSIVARSYLAVAPRVFHWVEDILRSEINMLQQQNPVSFPDVNKEDPKDIFHMVLVCNQF